MCIVVSPCMYVPTLYEGVLQAPRFVNSPSHLAAPLDYGFFYYPWQLITIAKVPHSLGFAHNMSTQNRPTPIYHSTTTVCWSKNCHNSPTAMKNVGMKGVVSLTLASQGPAKLVTISALDIICSGSHTPR